MPHIEVTTGYSSKIDESDKEIDYRAIWIRIDNTEIILHEDDAKEIFEQMIYLMFEEEDHPDCGTEDCCKEC
jgi:hypothetical protein